MLNRRTLLRSTVGLGAAGLLSGLRVPAFAQAAAPLAATTRTIDVDGRAATVLGLLRPDGGHGLTLDAGGRFAVALENRCGEPTLIHWHGLTPPWEQDGVPNLPKPLLAPGETRAYDFPVGEGGTFWMHAHTLQEQRLLAAPLIVRRAADRAADEQEVVVLLHDFAFRSPEEILADLRKPASGAAAAGGHAMPGMAGMAPMGGMKGMMDHGSMPMAGHDMKGMMDHGAMPMAGMKHDMGGMAGAGGMAGMAMDLNDIDYDAYLANDRTLSDPEVVRVEKGGTVRLRIIDGATSTAFVIDTGALEATLIEVDGQPVVPVAGRRFGMTMGQRIDLRVTLPKEGGAFPILALREGSVERTGIVLATAGAEVRKVPGVGSIKAPALDLTLERSLEAATPLAAKTPDRTHVVDLTGDMAGYSWAMSAENFPVKQGERVEITLRNHSMMSHPMHLHGHHFQVVAIDGERFAGAVRDTVPVPPMRTVTIAVDAGNPGKWAFHCHHLYHMATGMMAYFAYEGV
ncbi:MAG: multicopper oxidase domain-containing protein [Phyllobacteriaceae bacterium]|nr:multicopper oxidase domain-containing protein [Phyllobacteriaceae bacterium]